MSLLWRHYEKAASEPVPRPERVEKPEPNDSKAKWIDYAVAEGHQRGSLEELTKKEIQSLFE